MATYNRRRPQEYVDACAALDQVDILRNDIEMDPQRDTRPDLVRELKAKGYTDLDLFGMTHTLVARKR